MIRAHFDAVLALLAPLTSAPTNMPVIPGAADAADRAPALPQDRTLPFVVVRADNLPVTSDRLGRHSAVLSGLVYVVHVGETLRQVQLAQEKTRAVLVDKRPTVTGRSVGRLGMEDSSPVQVDRDVSPPLFEAVDLYRLFST